MIRKKQFVIFLVLMIIVSSTIISKNTTKTKSIDPFFTLFAKCGSPEGMDVLFLVKQQIARIGINLDIIRLDWPSFVAELIAFRDFDLIYIDYWETPDPFYNIPYPGDIYDCIEDFYGTLGIFGYFYGMDYDEELEAGLCETMQSVGGSTSPPNSQERIDRSWEWQHYVMDEILPFLPMFANKTFVSFWDQLEYFDYTKNIVQQWGKMYWEHTHTGQENTSEVVVADKAWENLNPLIETDSSDETHEADEFITNAVLDSLFWIDSDKRVWPHLVASWEHLSDTHFRMNLREGIKWQNDSENLFIDEYFDSEDAYFTLYCMKELNNDYGWMKNITKVDDYTIDIVIDTDHSTYGEQYYNLNYFEELSVPILPEHYLNQTQLVDGKTPDTVHESWSKFGESCFGTGLFEITDFKPGIETKLNLFTDSWFLDSTVTSDPNLNWLDRFGDFSGGLTQLRIRQFLDEVTEELEFESGKIDLFKFPSLQERCERRDEFLCNVDIGIQSKFTDSMSILGYNMREVRPTIGSLDDVPDDIGKATGLTIRKAISYAINRIEIQSLIFGQDKEIVTGPLHPSMGYWRNPESIKYCYNLDAAKRFMYIAGYDRAWCAQPKEASGWPDWETLCSGDIPTSIPSSISVNGISAFITFSILACLSGIYIRRKYRLKSTGRRD